MKLAVLLAFVPAISLAAPDEDLLGKSEGYPACLEFKDGKCLVGFWSAMDRFGPAHRIVKGAARPLPRAAAEPDLGLDDFLARNRNTGLLVMKDGVILAERYQYGRKAEDRFASASIAKTVVGMLFGIALAEGKIASIDDPARRYVPQLEDTPYGATSIRHLLTMSSGVSFVEEYSGEDDAAILARETVRLHGKGGVESVRPFKVRAAPPGQRFYYSSGDAQVLGLVLRAAVGKPLAEYLSEKIWQPMGAEFDATWLVDNSGYEAGYCCINAALRDYARFGMLLANYGRLDGRQIIPEAWVKAATTPEQAYLKVGKATPNNGYGYQTWLTDNTGVRFAALGVRGQAIFVDAARKIVVVHTAVHAQMRDREARRAQFALWRKVLNTL